MEELQQGKPQEGHKSNNDNNGKGTKRMYASFNTSEGWRPPAYQDMTQTRTVVCMKCRYPLYHREYTIPSKMPRFKDKMWNPTIDNVEMCLDCEENSLSQKYHTSAYVQYRFGSGMGVPIYSCHSCNKNLYKTHCLSYKVCHGCSARPNRMRWLLYTDVNPEDELLNNTEGHPPVECMTCFEEQHGMGNHFNCWDCRVKVPMLRDLTKILKNFFFLMWCAKQPGDVTLAHGEDQLNSNFLIYLPSEVFLIVLNMQLIQYMEMDDHKLHVQSITLNLSKGMSSSSSSSCSSSSSISSRDHVGQFKNLYEHFVADIPIQYWNNLYHCLPQNLRVQQEEEQ